MTTTRRLAAILAADVVGYSRLMGADEEGTLAALNAIRRQLVDPKLAEFGGRLVKTTGDGLLVEFPSVVQAMRCAVELQRAMAEHSRPVAESRRIQFRMGITLGDVIVEGDDIFGDGVNIAVRLEQIASPGGISISNRVYEEVRDRLAIGLQDGGEQQLKNIARPVRVWHWLAGANRLPTDATDFDWQNQKIKYCRTVDGVRLAYSVIGNGPPLVKAGGFLSHLQHECAVWGPGFLRLSNGRSLVRYDARGNGMSDWEVDDLSQEAWVTDLETVVDAAGLKRFGLIGFSQGCATSIAYAVRHPEKVSHLILYGGFARGGLETGDNERRESTLAQATLMRTGWSSSNPAYRQIYATRMLPDMTKKQAEDFDLLLRKTSSGDVAARYLIAAAEINVSELLANVRVPTLVMHMRDDAIVPFEAGKAMAAGIPGARFVGISGRSHVPLPGDPASERGFEEIDLFLNQQFGTTTGTNPSGEMPESGSRPLPDKPSIAVLPFQNMSGDPEQEYFADGMVEEIITALSRFKSLFVIARNSSFTYKGKAVDIKQVGRELGVRYVLEGSVRKAGARVRITGQLIEADTGSHLWAEKFDGSLENIFELQDDVATRVVGAIVPRVTNASLERSKQRQPALWNSYDHYLRGTDLRHRQQTPDGAIHALEEFRSAIELSPSFGLAWAEAAVCIYTIRNVYNQQVSEDVRLEALQMAARGIELAGDNEGVLTNGAFVLANLNNEFERGAALASQAVAINPNYANGWNAVGWMNLCLGNIKVAYDAFGRAMRLNPLDPVLIPNIHNGLACACMFAGPHSEGIGWAEQVLAHRPSSLLGLIALIGNALQLGRHTEADLAAAKIRQAFPMIRGSALKSLYPLRRPEHQSVLDRVIDCLEHHA
jgi:TolB-like protein/class 3 adenylate cyclase/pimeloyl-ACP methyl ester carboxylesterase